MDKNNLNERLEFNITKFTDIDGSNDKVICFY